MVEIRELNYADDTEVRGYYDSYVAAERAGNPAGSVHSYAETDRWMISINEDLGFTVHSTAGIFLKR